MWPQSNTFIVQKYAIWHAPISSLILLLFYLPFASSFFSPFPRFRLPFQAFFLINFFRALIFASLLPRNGIEIPRAPTAGPIS